MQITQEMIDDWSGPYGYRDFTKDATLYKFKPYKGGFAITGKGQYAIEARIGGHIGKTNTIPVWVRGKLPPPFYLVDPEFSLDEITQAQELINEQV